MRRVGNCDLNRSLKVCTLQDPFEFFVHVLDNIWRVLLSVTMIHAQNITERYEFLEKLGKGAYGTVYRVRDRADATVRVVYEQSYSSTQANVLPLRARRRSMRSSS